MRVLMKKEGTGDQKPPFGAPVIVGTPTENQILTANIDSYTDPNGVVSITYQWNRNGAPIIGATDQTYTLVSEDVGTTITVTAIITDSYNKVEEPVTSASVGPIIALSDPHFSNVKLLNNYDGNYSDSSAANHTLNVYGNTFINTTTKKFGTGSVYFDGSGDYITVGGGNTSDFAFGLGDFTIEAWVNVPAPTGGGVNFDRGIFGTMAAPSTFFFLVNGSNAPAFWDGSIQHTNASAVPTNTWSHVAYSRSGGTLRIYVDGVQGYSASHTLNMNNTSTKFIGGHVATGNRYFKGYVDELRVTKGVGRYTSNFIVPDRAFPIQ